MSRITILAMSLAAVILSGTTHAGDIGVIAPDLIYRTNRGGVANLLTKFQSLGIEKDAKIVPFPGPRVSFDVDALRKYSGVLLVIGSDKGANDSWFAVLRSYVKKGGRVFVLAHPGLTSNNTALMDNFGIAAANELVTGTRKKGGQASVDGSELCALFKGKVGSTDGMSGGPFMGIFFRTKDGPTVKSLRSQETGKDRVVSCLVKLGQGQIWFVSDFTCSGGGWGACPYSSILYDKRIDLYNNEEAALAIIEWLAQ